MIEGCSTAEPRMLVLARESRGWTQTELAQEMSTLSREGTISQGYVSKAEAGRLPVTGSRLDLFSRALRYPPAVLCQDIDVHGVGIGLVHHRKRASMGSRGLRRVHAILALTRLQTTSLARITNLGAGHRFRHITVDDFDTPEDAAETVREEWGVAPGSIRNLVALVEDAGAFVVTRDLGTTEIDAVSQWPQDGPPLFLVNSSRPADRFRFSLAHEVGHVFMHRQPGQGRQQESEADRFAAEFLMPHEGIRAHFERGVDLDRLAALKQRWGVSMSALARRAFDLDVLSEWQYRNIMVEMSAMGYRTQEPAEIPPEFPSRISSTLKCMEGDPGWDLDRIARLSGLTAREFEELYLSSPSLQKDRVHATPSR